MESRKGQDQRPLPAPPGYIVKNKITSVRDIIWYIRNVHLQKRRNSCLKRVPTEVKNVLKPLDIPRLSVMWEQSMSKSCRVTFFLFGRSLLNIKQNFEDYNNLIFANSIKRVRFCSCGSYNSSNCPDL